MFKSKYLINQNSVVLKFQEVRNGLIPFTKKVAERDIREWSAQSGASASLAHAEISRLSEKYPSGFLETGGDLIIYDFALAKLSHNCLQALGLPVNPTFTFSLEQQGSLASGDLKIVPSWRHSGQKLRVQRKGIFLKYDGDDFIIPDPIFSIFEVLEKNKQDKKQNVSDKMAMVAEVLNLVHGNQSYPLSADNMLDELSSNLSAEDVEKQQIILDDVLSRFKIKTARSMSFNIKFKNDHGYHISPVLFDVAPDIAAGSTSESNGLLSNTERLIFENDPEKGFFSSPDAKNTYLLESGEYILIDKILFPALQYVRDLKDAPPDVRESFATNPAKSISQIYWKKLQDEGAGSLSDDIQQEQLEALLAAIIVETKEYSDRVTELGLWVPPVVPWIKRQPNSWEPEEFGIYLDCKFISLPEDKIEELQKKIETAIQNHEKTVRFDGQDIPATKEVTEILSQLIGMVSPTAPTGPKGPGPNAPTEQQVLLVKDNFDELKYRRGLTKRPRYFGTSISSSISTTMFDHQDISLKWQISAYLTGLPGILNADDQGLGKTLQTIAFMAWLQENMKLAPSIEKKPILVVAPTTLLKNWATEVEDHMSSMFALGSRIDAYGSNLQRLKKTANDGSIYLDLGLEGQHQDDRICWVLTTYQTLAQNHREIAKIDFSAVIFDEIQNIKNVTTLAHRAAKTMKTDFTIGLTGTPVENDVSELWAIMDTVAPGSMGSLRNFTTNFKDAREEQYRTLHDEIFKNSYAETVSGAKGPPIGIRRMKNETIKNLPLKKYRFYPTEMPRIQAQAYDMVFAKLKNHVHGKALKVLHQLRTVSLYPGNLQQLQNEPDALNTMMAVSARIKSAIQIIDEIEKKGEKVLIFLETHEMQHVLRRLLIDRYNLEDIPILNGQATPARRGQIVDDFKSTLGDNKFAIRILSPKSAGVGITMIAATHIIHLSRWWNPAVEEQCNDRIYRIGQENDCTIHIPLAVHPHHQEATFDCILNGIMLRKRKLFRDVLMPSEDVESDQGAMIAGLSKSSFDLKEIDRLDWKEFEIWSGRTAHEKGVWSMKKTPRTGDGGLDTHLTHKERGDIVLVQCKYTDDHNKIMGSKPIHEILHSRTRYDVSKGYQCVVLTNADGFDNHAKQLALENDVILVDRHRLSLWPDHII
ncbi:SNF2-related protein [Planktomarina sp.]|nr:SNF2-related protein [Planktomarina sp.]